MPDYAAMYTSYWADPSRWGSCSLRDVEQTAEAILSTCGPGRLLDAGAGMGGLVRALLRHGVDARGMDVAPACVDEGNRLTPGRFVVGSLLEMPFEDGAFETVVSTDVLEHLAEEDVGRALAEMSRVARRGVFLRVATTPDRDGKWHLTVRDRAWWERRCFEAGLRRHPLMLSAVGFEALEQEGWQATLVMEKVPAAALARWPLESLRGERDLHMDMLRECGRRSDAHVARYHLACQFVRPGDAVLDVACGLGYGSAVLAAGTQARRVVGIDESESAIAYARDCFAAPGTPMAREIEFERGDAHDLSRLGDASVDVVVSFETLEHLREPGRFLDEVRRVLTPGGRLVLSVPNDWTDESGRDPNPHHMQVYTWDRLREEVGGRFILERRYAQVAGGGMKLKDSPRTLRETPTSNANGGGGGNGAGGPSAASTPESVPQAEWWLAVAMKEPVGAGEVPFSDTVYPDHASDPTHHVSAFGRDYENPWLVRAMIAMGLRCTSKAQLGAMAQRVIASADDGSVGPASPDLGAALCVLGYRLLDVPAVSANDADALLERLRAYERHVDATPVAPPHAQRWVVSNTYLAGQLLLATGRRGEARDEFRRCAAMDVLGFSPLLASKTIDASYHAGLIAAGDGDVESAGHDFRRGLDVLRTALDARDWSNIIGSTDEPLTFGLVDLQQSVELASRCAFGAACLPLLRDRPALAWTLVRRRALADLRRWTEQQTGSIEWLREQRRELERALNEARSRLARNESGGGWEGRVATLTQRLEEVTRQAGAERERQRTLIEEQRKSLEWAGGQRATLEERLRERDRTIESLRAFVEAQKLAEARLVEQKKSADARATQASETIRDLQAKIADLLKGRDWLRAKIERLEGHSGRHGGRGVQDRNDDPTHQSPDPGMTKGATRSE